MSFKGEAKKAATGVKQQPCLCKVLELAAIAAAVVWLVTGPLSCNGTGNPQFPANGPPEFLYLDGTRVLAYLAEFDGGNFTTKKLTEKSSNELDASIGLQGVEGGEKSQSEESTSKEIKATAAGNYIELLAKLENLHDGLTTIGLGRFQHDVSELTEGQFVRFKTHGLRPPIYLNPYLAVRQHETLSTLFPLPPKGEPGRERVSLQRANAERFSERVGDDPRVVFALRPLNERELEGKKLGKGEKENHVQYLMPIDARLLTKERSLIKFGGGEFTVVGKVVRIFPEDGNHNSPAYVDSPTVETWQQPLAAAPLKLLCRTNPQCVKVVRGEDVLAKESHEAALESRGAAIAALEAQTKIHRRGAVILPIAIYK
ncbi:MAG TPA: hypothetical protein VLK89_06515 [Solirubrobacterales bacterium]|nr:hypothetical protein [Solirubrobacterales bacterium]